MKYNPQQRDKVIAALESPKFKWRTIKGVAGETGLDSSIVQAIISDHEDIIIRSTIPSESGESLYTTREHFRKSATIFEKIVGSLKNRST